MLLLFYLLESALGIGVSPLKGGGRQNSLGLSQATKHSPPVGSVLPLPTACLQEVIL